MLHKCHLGFLISVKVHFWTSLNTRHLISHTLPVFICGKYVLGTIMVTRILKDVSD